MAEVRDSEPALIDHLDASGRCHFADPDKVVA
jgi:hypothetical protein